MIELWHLVVIFIALAVYLLLLVILFARMIAALLTGLVNMIPELVQGGAAAVAENPPIPKIKIIDAVGYGLVRFIQSPGFDGLIQNVIGKFGGGKKP